MAEYHLYFLRQGMLIGSISIEADDDSEAARIAREQGDGQFVEIWNNHRRVSVVTPTRHEDRAPLDPGMDAEPRTRAV